MTPLAKSQLFASKSNPQNNQENVELTVNSPTNLTNTINREEAIRIAGREAKKAVYEAAGLKFPQDVNKNPQVELLAKESAQIARKKKQSEFNFDAK